MDVELGLMMSIKHIWVTVSGSWVNTSPSLQWVIPRPGQCPGRLTRVFWFLSPQYQPGGPIHLSPSPLPPPSWTSTTGTTTRIISLRPRLSLPSLLCPPPAGFLLSQYEYLAKPTTNKKLSNIGLISENQNQCRSQTETLQKMHSIDIKTESILTGLFLSCRNESWPADYTMWNSNASPSPASPSAFHLYLKYFLFVNIQHLPSSCHNATIHSMNALKEEMGGSPSQFWRRKKSKYLLWPRYDTEP